MEQKSLSNLLKFIIIGIGVSIIAPLAIVFIAVIEKNFLQWGIFMGVSSVPCYIVLALGWQIAVNIGMDKSFCEENAGKLKYISLLAAGDSAWFFVVSITFLLLKISRPEITISSMLIVFIGVAISVVAAALSHLVKKAADLQVQSDLTI